MANKYTRKFSSSFGKAQVENDKNKAQAALDDNWDIELQKYEKITKAIIAELENVRVSLKKINEDAESGREVQNASKKAMEAVKTLKTNLNAALNKLSNALNQEQKAEYKRMKEWIKKQMATESQNITEM